MTAAVRRRAHSSAHASARQRSRRAARGARGPSAVAIWQARAAGFCHAGVSGPRATASTGSAEGWVGGVEDLEALASAGPGRLAARIMEAAWAFEKAQKGR